MANIPTSFNLAHTHTQSLRTNTLEDPWMENGPGQLNPINLFPPAAQVKAAIILLVNLAMLSSTAPLRHAIGAIDYVSALPDGGAVAAALSAFPRDSLREQRLQLSWIGLFGGLNEKPPLEPVAKWAPLEKDMLRCKEDKSVPGSVESELRKSFCRKNFNPVVVGVFSSTNWILFLSDTAFREGILSSCYRT